MSGTTKTAAFFVLVALVGAGGWFWQSMQTQKKLELENQKKELALKAKQADAAKAEDERKAKEAEARTAEANRKKSEADKAKAEAAAEAARTESDNLKAKGEAAKLAIEQSQAAKAAAEAETAKQEAAKAAAEAKEKELAKQHEVEALSAKRAADERAKAEAELTRTLAAKKIADAALEKSENERKAAEENAKAERDKKLRMYKRAVTSRAEYLDLQRAERLLALDEAGLLTNGVAAAALDAEPMPTPAVAEDGTTNEVVEAENDPEVAKIRQQGVPAPEMAPLSQVEQELKDLNDALDGKIESDRRRRDADYRKMFAELIEQAEKDGRMRDAAYYRRVLDSLVSESAKASTSKEKAK